MPKWCLNYETGEYEYIEENGFSITRGQYVYNWDKSEYEEERRLKEENDSDEYSGWADDWDDTY